MKPVLKHAMMAAALLLAGGVQAAGVDTSPVQVSRQSDLAAGKTAIDAKD